MKITNRVERYLKMFDSENLLDGYRGGNETEQPRKHKLITKLVGYCNEYPRKDQLTWILRNVKAFNLLPHLNSNLNGLTKPEGKFLNRMLGLNGRNVQHYAMNQDEFDQKLQHFKDANIASVNNYQYENQPIISAFSELEALEEEWKEKQSRRINVDFDDVDVVYEKDGYQIMNLNVSGCSEEGAAMGHCGNGSGNSDQRVLSLRSKNSDGTWTPHVTIIMNNCEFNADGTIKSGVTGEIKGYGNEKPSEKYHKIMADFLRSEPFVHGMKGGGYLPENNLSLFDFDKDTLSTLLAEKPNFLSSIDKLLINNGVMTEEIIKQFNTEFKDFMDQDGLITLDNNLSLSALADNYSMDELLHYSDYIDGTEHLSVDVENPESSVIESAIDDIEMNYPRVFNGLKAAILKHQEFSETDLSLDSNGIAQFIYEYISHEDIGLSFNSAYANAFEGAVFDEIHSAKDEAISSLETETGLVITKDDDEHYSIKINAQNFLNQTLQSLKDEGVQLGFVDNQDVEYFCEVKDSWAIKGAYGGCDSSSILEEYITDDVTSDLDVPHYGFESSCTVSDELFAEYAAERLVEDAGIEPVESIDFLEKLTSATMKVQEQRKLTLTPNAPSPSPSPVSRNTPSPYN
ncbi:hypothetical protein VCHA53O466_50448 [Vibrio chagasii]|nr:hypothetical protein VCHA53O466_50448 [Vibrio chagasii]